LKWNFLDAMKNLGMQNLNISKIIPITGMTWAGGFFLNTSIQNKTV